MKLINFYDFPPLNDLIERMGIKPNKEHDQRHSKKLINVENNEDQIKAKDISE